jgi:hypothetical protein
MVHTLSKRQCAMAAHMLEDLWQSVILESLVRRPEAITCQKRSTMCSRLG